MERKSSLSMEAMKFYGYHDQTISPYKRISTNAFISTPNPHHFMLHKMGVLQTPPPFHSYPPYTFQQPPLPPLLPLPTANPRQPANSPGSLPVNNKVNNTNRSKKSKSFSKNTKKDGNNLPKRVTVSSTTTTTSLGSNANKLQKDVKKALPFVPVGTTTNGVSTNSSSSSAIKAEEDHVGMFLSSGVFAISPPPSSLPLPTFSLRPKRSCSTEAVPAIDTRATDSLRRMLQLRSEEFAA